MTSPVAKIERHPPPQPVTPMQMLAMAIERGADMEQLEKLLNLQERWEAGEARKAFVAAKAAFKAEPVKIEKNKRVRYSTGKGETEYDHATLDHVANAVGPALGKHGLTYSWKTDQGDGGVIRVTCILTHELGHSEQVTLSGSPDNSGGKNNIQAVGSTVTYLQRYTLLSILGMAASDQDDDDGAGHGELISPAQKSELVESIKATGTDPAKFLAYLKIATLDELPASQFQLARAALAAKAAKAAWNGQAS